MGPVMLTLEAEEVVQVLKEKISSVPVLVFLDFNKPFLLEIDASKEELGAMLPQKQDDRHYHPVAFGSRMLMPSQQNYHSSKLEFLALKMEHYQRNIWPKLHLECIQTTSTDICADNTESGCYWTLLGWGTHIL